MIMKNPFKKPKKEKILTKEECLVVIEELKTYIIDHYNDLECFKFSFSNNFEELPPINGWKNFRVEDSTITIKLKSRAARLNNEISLATTKFREDIAKEMAILNKNKRKKK